MKTILDQLRDIESLPPPTVGASAGPGSGSVPGLGRFWLVILIVVVSIIALFLFFLVRSYSSFSSTSTSAPATQPSFVKNVEADSKDKDKDQIWYFGLINNRVFYSIGEQNGDITILSSPDSSVSFLYGMPKQIDSDFRVELANYIPFRPSADGDDHTGGKRNSRTDRSVDRSAGTRSRVGTISHSGP
jgi:hypothetical protein